MAVCQNTDLPLIQMVIPAWKHLPMFSLEFTHVINLLESVLNLPLLGTVGLTTKLQCTWYLLLTI